MRRLIEALREGPLGLFLQHVVSLAAVQTRCAIETNLSHQWYRMRVSFILW